MNLIGCCKLLSRSVMWCFSTFFVLAIIIYYVTVSISSRTTAIAPGDMAPCELTNEQIKPALSSFIQPILLVSEGRSGSSFTLQLLGSLKPLVLTHFEPLMSVELDNQYLTLMSDNSTTAEDVIADMFRCRFQLIFDADDKLKRPPEFVWNICDGESSSYGHVCYNRTDLEEACRLIPIQVIDFLYRYFD